MKREFNPEVPLTIHWDGKIIRNNVTGKKEERLPILVTGEGTSKLLTVPALPNGKAAEGSGAIVNAIEDWNLKDKIVAMSFDTTNTNSGCKNGMITRVPKMLKKPLLSLACRHHVAELVLKHCYEMKGDKSQSDKLDNFKKFKEEYNAKLESHEVIEYRSVLHVPALEEITSAWRQNVIDFCLSCMNQKHPRGDYVELLELVVLFLGGDTEKGIKFRRAGSLSRARWMARAIYILKIWMVNKQIETIDLDLMDHFEKLALFISKCYTKYWFRLSNAVSVRVI